MHALKGRSRGLKGEMVGNIRERRSTEINALLVILFSSFLQWNHPLESQYSRLFQMYFTCRIFSSKEMLVTLS